MSLWQTGKNIFGGAIATGGQLFGLPEMGFSETITGSSQQTRPWLYGSLGGAFVEPAWTGAGWTGGVAPAPAPTRQVLGTTAPTGGGGGTYVPPATAPTQPSTPTQQPPQPKMPTYSGPTPEDILADVDAAYNTFASELQAATEEGIKSLESQAEAQKAMVKGEEKRRVGAYELERGQEKTRQRQTLSDIAREYSELSAGMGARYGARSGAGRAALGILGSATMQARAKIRTAYQNTIDKINKSISDVRSWASDKLFQVEEGLRSDIASLQADLQAKLAKAAQAKAATRANLSMQAWQDYQTQLNNLRTMAYDLQQKIYFDMVQVENDIRAYSQKARATYSTFEPEIRLPTYAGQGATPTQMPYMVSTAPGSWKIWEPPEEEEKLFPEE